MTPPESLDDLADRLGALEAHHAFRLWQMFDRQGADPAMSSPVRALMASLARAVDAEHRRRTAGELYRLDEVAECIAALPDADLAEGVVTHAKMRDEGAGVLPEAMLAVHNCVGQMLAVESRERGRAWRATCRDVITGDRVVGWWGDRRDTPGEDSGGSVGGEA